MWPYAPETEALYNGVEVQDTCEVTDRRVPGSGGAQKKKYLCPLPGCRHTKREYFRPTCPKHRLPMKEAT